MFLKRVASYTQALYIFSVLYELDLIDILTEKIKYYMKDCSITCGKLKQTCLPGNLVNGSNYLFILTINSISVRLSNSWLFTFSIPIIELIFNKLPSLWIPVHILHIKDRKKEENKYIIHYSLSHFDWFVLINHFYSIVNAFTSSI